MLDYEGLSLFALSIHATIWLSLSKRPVIFSCHAGLRRTYGGKTQSQLATENDSKEMAKAREMQVVPKVEEEGVSLTSAERESLNSRIEKIIRSCPSLRETNWAPMLWFNRHLQLIPFMLMNYWHKLVLPPVTYHSQRFEMEDGEVLVLDWALPAGKSGIPLRGDEPQWDTKEASVLILHHGAYCRSNDMPGFLYVQDALAKGWYVVVLNRRGHRGRLQNPCFNFFGHPTDVRHIIERNIRAARPEARVFMLGISAGSGLVARYLGEQGLATKQYCRKFGTALDDDDTLRKKIYGYVEACVCIAPGYNVEVCMGRFDWPYQPLLLSLGKQFFLEKNEKVLLEKRGDEKVDKAREYCYEKALNAKGFQEWLDSTFVFANNSPAITGRKDSHASGKFDIFSTPPVDGKFVPGARSATVYKSKEEYHDYHNPMRVVHHIVSPLFIVNSEDDPLCMVRNVYESLYLFDEYTIGAVVALVKTGSHCAFLQGQPWNPFSMYSWTERAVSDFFQQF